MKQLLWIFVFTTILTTTLVFPNVAKAQIGVTQYSKYLEVQNSDGNLGNEREISIPQFIDLCDGTTFFFVQFEPDQGPQEEEEFVWGVVYDSDGEEQLEGTYFETPATEGEDLPNPVGYDLDFTRGGGTHHAEILGNWDYDAFFTGFGYEVTLKVPPTSPNQ